MKRGRIGSLKIVAGEDAGPLRILLEAIDSVLAWGGKGHNDEGAMQAVAGA
jgi:hypothetical protein